MVLRTGLRRPAPTSRSGDGEGDEGGGAAWEGLCGCIHVCRYAVKMELG